jgi:transglutaminase-like putative cysteine protease
MYPEPSKSSYLITLNVPQQVSGIRTRESGDGVFMRSYGSTTRTRYGVTALPDGRLRERAGVDRGAYLQLPPGLSPAMKELARKTAAGARSGREILQRFEEFYRAGGFRYVTSGLPTGDRPLDTFLFDRRQGNCEFFASSLATLLRQAGVPARLVGGYLGGEYNELGGYYAVTEDRAHVWVEASLDGSDWTTVDPSRWAVNAGERDRRARPGMLARLRQTADAVEYFWTRTVISYDLEKQLEVVRGAGRRWSGVKPRLPGLGFAVTSVALLLVAGIVYALRFRRRQPPEEKLLGMLFSRLQKQGRLPPGYTGMGLFRLADHLRDPVVQAFAERYGAAVYHDRPLTAEEYRELRGLVRQVGKDAADGNDRDGRTRPDAA